jgi:hypothetical protein
MNWFGWFLVIMVSVFVLSVIILGLIIIFKLRHRKNVHGIIFLKAGGQKKFLINRQKSKVTIVNNEAYNFHENGVIKTTFKDWIYYYENNPNPVIPDFVNSKFGMSASDEKTILENDLITKLFNNKELKTIQLLILITMVTGIISLFMLVYLIMGGVKVKQTPELYDFIYNATRTAIMGY